MQLQTYIRFNDGKCREAMNFYKQCFGGELTFQTGGESPMANDMPPEKHDRIVESHLQNGTFEIHGSDMFMDIATVGDNFHLRVTIDKAEDFDRIFQTLSSGGEVFMQPEQTEGRIDAMVTDKYGIEWGLVGVFSGL